MTREQFRTMYCTRSCNTWSTDFEDLPRMNHFTHSSQNLQIFCIPHVVPNCQLKVLTTIIARGSTILLIHISPSFLTFSIKSPLSRETLWVSVSVYVSVWFFFSVCLRLTEWSIKTLHCATWTSSYEWYLSLSSCGIIFVAVAVKVLYFFFKIEGLCNKGLTALYKRNTFYLSCGDFL